MLVFIDETGDHNLQRIDPQYPIFGLGALLISESEYQKMNKEVERIKKEFFVDEDNTFILHSSELKRPKDKRSDKRNIAMLKPETRAVFYKEIDEHIVKAADPYHFSFENLLNRIVRYGDAANVIYVEKRGTELDTQLMSEYERLSKIGIHSYPADIVIARTNLKLVSKAENICGLQVIDLILSCLARVGLGKKDKMVGNDLDIEYIKLKHVCPLTIFPSNRKKSG